MKGTLAILLVTAACAKGGGSGAAIDASGGGGGDGGGGGGDGGGSAVGTPCPAGSYATNIDRAGVATCDTPDAAEATALADRCSVYLGQRDSCDGCTDPPAKWGAAGTVACDVGAGAGNTCATAALDTPVQLMGLDLDGDVDGNDKLYASLHCQLAPRDPQPQPCAPGWFITGKLGDTWECSPVSEVMLGYVRASCAIYTGWQDSCDGCVTPPVKWGYASDGACGNGAGADDTCQVSTLGTESVSTFGLSFDGDVDQNDKIHVGLHCKAPAAGGSALVAPPAMPMCPAGQLATGVTADGSPTCADPSSQFASYFGAHCSLYFGWRDGCDGCSDPPTKWGVVRDGACTNGAGADDTCTAFALGGETVTMFGLSPDGNVDGNDKLYVGFRCE